MEAKRASGLAAIAGPAGAVAIGALAIRKLLVDRASFQSVNIDDLTVRRLRVSELILDERR
jgi:hypothetical protein